MPTKKRTAPRKARATPAKADMPRHDYLLPLRPFPKEAVLSPLTFHDLGPVTTPAQQAKAAPAAARPEEIEASAEQAIRSLAGTGPIQTPPHAGTAIALDTAIALLRDHAIAGDADAFNWLGYLIANAVADFHEVARRHPEAAAEWGKRRGFLPMLVTRRIAKPSNKTTAIHTELEGTFNLFRLGEECCVRVNPDGGRNPGAETPVNVLAGNLCQHLANTRDRFQILRPPIPQWAKLAADLPELSRDTARAWGEAAWELLRASFDNDHELVEYCDLGNSGKKGTREIGGGKGVSGQVSGIRFRLLRAVAALAPF